MTYLITGATGDVGARVVRRLISQNIRPRIFVRSSDKAQALFGYAAEICVGDFADPASTRSAMEGVHTLFLVNVGPEIPQRDELGGKRSPEKKGSGASSSCRHSMSNRSFAIGAWHEKGEAAIRASGVEFTFVRPTGFMTNLLAWAHSIKAEGIVRTSTGNGGRPFIHSEDIAAVSVAAMLDPGLRESNSFHHRPQIAELWRRYWRSLARAIGKPLVYQDHIG